MIVSIRECIAAIVQRKPVMLCCRTALRTVRCHRKSSP